MSLTDFAFTPNAIIVGKPNSTSGDYATIVWTNTVATAHTVTSGDGTTGTPDGLFNSGTLSQGNTFTLKINQTMYDSIIAKYPDGFVHYYCSFHYFDGMVGTITVSSTEVPEFSLPTLLLTITMIFAITAYILHLRRNKTLQMKS